MKYKYILSGLESLRCKLLEAEGIFPHPVKASVWICSFLSLGRSLWQLSQLGGARGIYSLMQFRHSYKAKDPNHSICSYHRTCEWNKQLPLPMLGWQKCLWLAKNPAADVHSNPSSTRGAWRYYRFHFDHSWTVLHEQGFHVVLSFFCVHLSRKELP